MQVNELLLVKAPEKPFDKDTFPPESRFYEFPIAIFQVRNAPYTYTWRGEHQDLSRSRRDRQLTFTAAARIIFVGDEISADADGRPFLHAIRPVALDLTGSAHTFQDDLWPTHKFEPHTIGLCKGGVNGDRAFSAQFEKNKASDE